MRRAALSAALIALIAAVVFVLSRRDDEPAPTVVPSAPRDTVVVSAESTRSEPHRRTVADRTDTATSPAAALHISGVVLDAAEGAPIADAEILVARRRTPVPELPFLDGETPGEAEVRTTTSAVGKFRAGVPDAGPWLVTVRAPEHVDAAAVAGAGDTLEMRLFADSVETLTVVRDDGETPIAGAEVIVLAENFKPPARLRLVTDENGVVTLHVCKGETLMVGARDCATTFEHASAGERRVRLKPGACIAGVVRDHAGQGVAGAVLRIATSELRAWKCDAEGRFSVDGVWMERGCCPFEVQADGYLQWVGPLACGATDEVVELRRAVRVEGTVLGPDGKPAARVAVESLADPAVTDASGAFNVEINPQTPQVHAHWEANGVVLDGRTAVDAADGGTVSGVVVRLAHAERPRGSFIVLHVVDSAGHLVYDVDLGGFGGERCGDRLIRACNDPPGTKRTVSLRDIARKWSARDIDVVTQASQDATPTEVRLPELREFTVEVRRPNGEPFEWVAVKMLLGEEATSHDEVARVRADVTSTTWVVGCSKRYFLSIESAEFAAYDRMLTEDEIAAGKLVVRLDPGVTVRGRLVCTDPAMLRRVDLWFDRDLRIGGDARRVNPAIECDEDGAFRVSRVAAGSWRLSVFWEFATVVERAVRVAGGDDVDLGDVVVPPPRVVRGVVELPDGRPCGGATIEPFMAYDEIDTPSTPTGADGAFAIEAPSLRGCALLVLRRGVGAAVVSLDDLDPTRPLVVRLATGGRIDVRARRPFDAPQQWRLAVRVPGGVVFKAIDATPVCDMRGFDHRVVFDFVPPGRATVFSEELRLERDVDVVAGRTVEVVLGPER